MYEYYMTFRSMTSAQQAALLLMQNGVNAAVLRAPRFLSEKGCGYAVGLNDLNVYLAVRLLRQFGNRFERVFRVRPGFTPEVVAL